MSSFQQLCRGLESAVQRDLAGRGLCSAEHPPLCSGDLAEAATRLSDSSATVAIVTGFYIPHGDPPAAETDGMLGSLFLASVLRELGRNVFLVCDRYALGALGVGLAALNLPESSLLEFPMHPANPAGASAIPGACDEGIDRWIVDFFDRFGVGQLIAVERVGPAHTPESLQRQRRDVPAPLKDFQEQVPPESWDQCHNMAGRNITPYTAATHRLFDYAREHRREVTTIGVGDGGNEIGMGKVPWEELCRRIPRPAAAATFCRVETDYNVVGGTSDWGAFALGAALLVKQGAASRLRSWDRAHAFHILEGVVQRGPAVDGVTGRQQPTVDGLAFDAYFDVIEDLRRSHVAA